MASPTIGLALGSGMARGWAHIGVWRALRDAGIEPDIVAGTSIGALVGGVALAGHLDELEAFARSLTPLRLIRHLDISFRGGGLVNGLRLTGMLRETLGGARFEELPARFACVATDLFTGHEVWLRKGRLARAMRASFSLPGAFKPVRLHGRWLVDGALVNPVPVSVCHALGAEIVIAVNVNADHICKREAQAWNKAEDPLSEALKEGPINGNGRARSLVKLMFGAKRGSLTMLGVMSASLHIMQDRIARSRLAGDPPDITITPNLAHIGLTEFNRAAEVVEAGRIATERALGDLRGTMLGCDDGAPAAQESAGEPSERRAWRMA